MRGYTKELQRLQRAQRKSEGQRQRLERLRGESAAALGLQSEELLTGEEAAQLLGVSRTSVVSLRRQHPTMETVAGLSGTRYYLRRYVEELARERAAAFWAERTVAYIDETDMEELQELVFQELGQLLRAKELAGLRPVALSLQELKRLFRSEARREALRVLLRQGRLVQYETINSYAYTTAEHRHSRRERTK